MKRLSKSFTQQEPIPETGIERAIEIMRTGRLHRYNVANGEEAETAILEREYASWQGADYCVACASGGYALHIAMRASGLAPGEIVLTNAWTLAPVPGAIHNAGGVPVLVEIDEDWHIDILDLREKAAASGAKFLLLSHMRGHISDMEAITNICRDFDITLIEDCAHTMGARWKGKRSGNFGRIACFSTQTYKHINSGEGGLLTTNDPALAARAVILSGSYMLYDRHGAIPAEEVFCQERLTTPNYSGRMDNLRAAILRAQLPLLEKNIRRWNILYRTLENGLSRAAGIRITKRAEHEEFVGSSIQFHVDALSEDRLYKLIAGCAERGVDIKWFGSAEPNAYTSRYDSWRYLDDTQPLPRTLRVLSSTCDMRIPLTFAKIDCEDIIEIVSEESARLS